MMQSWQLKTPIDAILFDCDGTLSQIEGIDELAKRHQVTDIVQRLTRDAMGKSGMNPEIYAERLRLTQPLRQDLALLADEYFQQKAPDIMEIIAIFQRLQKEVYVVSAGLLPAVLLFAKKLQISPSHVFAVDIHFDQNGKYQDFDRASPMVYKNGKQYIVEKIKLKHPHLAFVGDGLSDYEVYSHVTRFIGYGGAFYRENIASLCEFYIKELGMASLLPLLLTDFEYEQLTLSEKNLYHLGMQAITHDKVKTQPNAVP